MRYTFTIIIIFCFCCVCSIKAFSQALPSNFYKPEITIDSVWSAYVFGIAAGDIDGDGRPEILSGEDRFDSLEIYRNISTPGSINKCSFIKTGIPFQDVRNIVLADIDGDGKVDVVVTKLGTTEQLSVFRNISTPGNINFASRVNFTLIGSPYDIAVGDLSGDGKPDIGVTLFDWGKVAVMMNTSTPGSISFVTADLIALEGAHGIAIADIDKDGKQDLAVTQWYANTVTIFRSTGSSGTILFAAPLNFATGAVPMQICVGDFNSDGKLDVATTNNNENSVSVLQNTSSPGNINFASQLKYTAGFQPYGITAGDIDGDVKPDLVIASFGAGPRFFTVLRNISSQAGAIAFSDSTNFGNTSTYVAIADLDLDGKQEIIQPKASAGIKIYQRADAIYVPGTITQPASSITSTSAILHGEISDHGASTTVTFEYSTSSTLATFTTVAATTGGTVAAGSCPAAANVYIAGLTPGTVYYFRIKGSNSSGTGFGNILSFTTDGISAPATTTTSLASSLNPSIVGQSVTFTTAVTATSGTPTGTVSFYDGTTLLGTGILSGNTATYTTLVLTTGSHNITAVYAGNGSYATSTSSVLIQVVSPPPPAATTTSLISSFNPSTFGQGVTFTATVIATSGTPTGTVSFYDGTTLLGTGTLSGNTATYTTSSLTIGSHNITAVYAGTTGYTTSTSSVLIQVVSPPPPAATATSITSSLNPSTLGQPVIFTATVTATSGTPTGTVSFYDGTALFGTSTLSGNTSSFTISSLGLGRHSITAKYNGDVNYGSSISPVLYQTIYVISTPRLFRLYPNPIKENTIAFQWYVPKGFYTLRLTTLLGQVLLTKVIDHPGGSGIETIELSKSLSAGIYMLQVTGTEIIFLRKVIKN